MVVGVILVVGAYLVAVIGAVTGHRPKEGEPSLMRVTRAGWWLLVIATIIMMASTYKEILSAKDSSTRERREEELLTKNEHQLKTLRNVEVQVQAMSAQVATITTSVPQARELEAVASKVKAIQRELGEEQAASPEIVVGETVTDVFVHDPTGRLEYTLEARVASSGRTVGKVEGAVAFFLNGQELRPRAPLLGDKARLYKVEVQEGLNKVAAQFIPSSSNYHGSQSQPLHFETK